MNIDDKEVMQALTKMAMKQAMTYFAKMAREFAKTMPPDATAEQALTAFANAIESTNAKVWPTENRQ